MSNYERQRAQRRKEKKLKEKALVLNPKDYTGMITVPHPTLKNTWVYRKVNN